MMFLKKDIKNGWRASITPPPFGQSVLLHTVVKKNDSAVSLNSSQPSLSPCPSRVLTGPLMSCWHSSSFFSLFHPRKSCFALHIFILALQVHFLLILSLIFLYLFVLFKFISQFCFSIASSFNFLVYYIWSLFFWFIFSILLIYLLLVFQNQSF
jgi:hypothetical protein